MPRQTEIKIRLGTESRFRDLQQQAERLAKPQVIVQRDHYYVTQGKDERNKVRLSWPVEDPTLRLSEMITYHRRDHEATRLSTYEKTFVTDLTGTLARLGKPEVVVNKERIVVIHEQTRIHLDRVAGLEPPYFMELEVMLHDQQSHESGQQVVQQLLDLLGVTLEERTAQVERGSYRELLLSKAS